MIPKLEYFTIPLALSLVGIIAHFVYRVWFHPLSGHPGPLLAKVSNIYAGYHAWKGDLHIDMWRCHEKYGNFVRYAPNRLLVNTDTGLHDIYGYGKNVQKSVAYTAMVHRAPNTLTLIDKKCHGRRRRIISQGFGDTSLRKYQPAILERIDRLCSVVSSSGSMQWSRPYNMARYFSYLSFDIMTKTIFGEDYNLIEKSDQRFVVEDIDKSNIRTSVLIQAPELSTFRLDRRFFPQSIRSRNRFIQFVSSLLQTRHSREHTGGQDVFSFLVDAKDLDTDYGLRRSEIAAESTTLIIAGSDTSSTTFCALFYYLMHNPAAYRRVNEEVRSKFDSIDSITLGPTLSSCIYLHACIDEALRLSPPAGGALWREVGPAGGVFGGIYVPAGCDVGVGIYAIHHNATYYPSPFRFYPERWFEEDAKKLELGSVTLARSAFNPFSIGPRSCIGKGFAIAELMLVSATLLWKFDVRGSQEQGNDAGDIARVALNEEFRLHDHVTGQKYGPFLQFRPSRYSH